MRNSRQRKVGGDPRFQVLFDDVNESEPATSEPIFDEVRSPGSSLNYATEQAALTSQNSSTGESKGLSANTNAVMQQILEDALRKIADVAFEKVLLAP